jgi:uncharacterized protein
MLRSLMLFLIASLLVLGVGPSSYALAEHVPLLFKALDLFVVVAVGALVLLHIVPETVEKGGLVLLLPMLVGLLGPTVLERALSGLERQTHVAVVLFVLIGLAVHALLDGVALVLPHAEESLLDLSLPMAVVLHRVPVSLLLWWLIRPTYGVGLAWLALAIEGLGTVVGFVLAQKLAAHLASPAVAIVQALVAGSLLHVVVDRPHTRAHAH